MPPDDVDDAALAEWLLDRYVQGNDHGTQYRSAIFPQTAAQRAAAVASGDAYQVRLTAAGFGPITTEISGPPVPEFYPADD